MYSELEFIKRYVPSVDFIQDDELKNGTFGKHFDHSKDNLTCQLLNLHIFFWNRFFNTWYGVLMGYRKVFGQPSGNSEGWLFESDGKSLPECSNAKQNCWHKLESKFDCRAITIYQTNLWAKFTYHPLPDCDFAESET